MTVCHDSPHDTCSTGAEEAGDRAREVTPGTERRDTQSGDTKRGENTVCILLIDGATAQCVYC